MPSIIETAFALPLSFWVVIATIVGGAVWASGKIRAGIGLPMLAVLGTVAAWYVGDLFYNDYKTFYQTFNSGTIENAWWEVAAFLIAFLIGTPSVHEMVNSHYLRKTSTIYRLSQRGVNDSVFQETLRSLLQGSMVVWVVLAFIAVFRLGNEIPYYFFPFLDHKADPWARGRLGGGLDSLLSLAGYLLLFSAASFGVVAALAKNPRVRSVAIFGCVVAWPYFIFDRTRNVMLSAVLPGLLAFAILRLRGTWLKKGIVLCGAFILIDAWFGFVLANRSDMTITEALHQKGFTVKESASVHNEGLNMFQELCWTNDLIADGSYQPNWGQRYFAEIVGPIPRVLWPDKPMPGIDYAVARGFSYGSGEAGVVATISTGMIGQGVVNFGRVIGPVFAALLMSIWAAVLARMDLRGREITLYGLGLTLTFNLGRDITLLTLFTFIFGAMVVWFVNRLKKMKTDRAEYRQAQRSVRAHSRALPPRPRYGSV